MKVLHAVVGFVLSAAALVVGGAVAWYAFARPASWDAVLVGQFAPQRPEAGAWAIAVVLLVLIWALSGLPRRDRARYLSFENPGGDVRVSLDAIRDYVGRLARGFEEVVSMRPAVTIRREQLRVDVECRVRAGTPIPAFSRTFQERVRESLQADLGLTDLPPIGLVVRQIVGQASPAAPAEQGTDEHERLAAGEDSGDEPRVT